MSLRYIGGFVSTTPPTASRLNGTSGVFTLSQQFQYKSEGEWTPFQIEVFTDANIAMDCTAPWALQ